MRVFLPSVKCDTRGFPSAVCDTRSFRQRVEADDIKSLQSFISCNSTRDSMSLMTSGCLKYNACWIIMRVAIRIGTGA